MTEQESMIQRYVLKPATVGGVAYLGNNMFISGKTIKIRGQEYPLTVVASGAVALGSVLSEIAHDYIVPHIHYLDKIAEPSSLALASATTGGGNVAVHYQSRGDGKGVEALGAGNLFLLGAVSEMVGDTVFSKCVNPTLQSMV